MCARLGSVLAVPAVAALALGVLAGPAQAEVSVVHDVSGDVVDEETGETLPMGADGESSADVVRTTLGHSRERVKIVVEVRDLGPGRGVTPTAEVFLRAPGNGLFRVERTATPQNRPYARLIDQNSLERVPCRVASYRSPQYDRIAFELDRSCLSDPTWLRFGARTNNRSDGTRAGVTDDARLATESPGLPKIGGPRVYAGATR